MKWVEEKPTKYIKNKYIMENLEKIGFPRLNFECERLSVKYYG